MLSDEFCMATHVVPIAVLFGCLSNIQGSIMHSSYVYILASQRNGTFYVGSTSDLIKRTWEHKNKVISGFTAQYNVLKLVYYEVHELYIEAARLEKRFKNWPRQWKINLIEGINPEWCDLYEEICR